MNTNATSMAAQPSFPLHMSNVIDSLKRLERLGSEESQTVQKILEAANQLSDTIGRHFPASLRGKSIIAHVDEDGSVRLGEWVRKNPSPVMIDGKTRLMPVKPRHVFHTYQVEKSSYKPQLLLVSDDETRSVSQDRDTALLFSKDIANGLLEALNQFIEDEHKTSEEGWDVISAAAESLKQLPDTQKSDDDLPF